MLPDLVTHKGYANAALLQAIRANAAAAADPELRDLLHHVLLANRFWLLTIVGEPFVLADEARVSDSLDELIDRYRALQDREAAWFVTATEDALARILEDPQIPGGRCPVSDAWLQVCLHSHGHRAQAAKLLRRHGGVPPATDYVLWLAGRPAADWGARPLEP